MGHTVLIAVAMDVPVMTFIDVDTALVALTAAVGVRAEKKIIVGRHYANWYYIHIFSPFEPP